MEPKQYSDDLATTVRDACARVLFLDAWASAIESGECPACGARDLDAVLESEGGDSTDYPDALLGLRDAIDSGDPCPACGRAIPRASSGDNWDDVLDGLETPAEAYACADGVLDGLDLSDGDRRGPAWTRSHVVDWALAVEGVVEPGDYGLEGNDLDADDYAERFGTLLGFQALGHGVGLGDDVRGDSRSIVEVDGGAWAVQSWNGSDYVEESRHDSREAALDALRATRYSAPRVPSVEFHAWDFDGGALLACSEGCRGIVAGEHGVEACGSCGGDDDDRAAVHFGRLLANAGRLGEAFGLLDGGRVVLDADEAQLVAEAVADAVPRAGEAWAVEAGRLVQRLGGERTDEGRAAVVGSIRRIVLAAEARKNARDLRSVSNDWAYNGGESPSPTDLDDWADLLDRLADALDRGES